ncbi:conserved exported hypothetical protein [Sphingobacterium sp. PM2-P1-29]|nr:conserved exported hypothetical protein [Sphingobacterium sp. PM2-P1-29]
MKRTLALIFFFSIFLNSFFLIAQDNKINRGKITYAVSLSYKKGVPKNYDGTLFFDDQKSVFVYDKNTNQGEVREERYDGGQSIRVISKGRITDNIGLIVYSDFGHGKMVERNMIQGRPFIIADTLRNIQWTLENGTKEIEGIKCQKAKGTVHGREYEVWFATNIPLSYGPWKLQGLPGLIMQANSTDGEINFEVKSIKQLADEEYQIVPPTTGEEIKGYVNFYELQDKKANEMAKSMQANMAELKQSGNIGSTVSAKIRSNVLRPEKSSSF